MSRQIIRSATSGLSYPRLVMRAASVMLLLIFILIKLEAPFWLTYLISFAAMVFTIALYTAKATYTLRDEGIGVHYNSFLQVLGLHSRVRLFPWSSLKSYRIEEKLIRPGLTKKYLELYFENPVEKLVIYEGDSAAELESFFLELLDTIEKINAAPASIPGAAPRISARKSYYVTLWGRTLTLLFLVLVAFSSWMLLKFGLFLSNILLVLMMVSAGSYLVYRSFLHKKD